MLELTSNDEILLVGSQLSLIIKGRPSSHQETKRICGNSPSTVHPKPYPLPLPLPLRMSGG